MKNKKSIQRNQQQEMIHAILNLLCDREVLNREDIAELEREYEKSNLAYFEDYLIDEELIEKEDLIKVLQDYYNVPAMDVMGEMFDHDLLRKFPKDVLLRNNCIPYRQDGAILIMITSNPLNEDLDEILGEFVSYDFQYYVGIPRHIDMMIKDFYDSELYKEDYEEIIDEEAREHEDVILEDNGDLDLVERGKDDE